MLPDEKMIMGIAGTAVSAVGASISVTELQAIISIVVTVSGFVISVLIPLIIKLVKKIKKAKEDGVITEEEKQDILETGKEIVEETKEFIEESKEKKSLEIKGEVDSPKEHIKRNK